MLIKTTLEQRGPITREEIELLKMAEKMPLVFDEDNPELTEEDLKGFHPKGKLGRGLAQVRAGQGIVKTMEELERMAEETKIAQIQLPDPADADPHPRLLLEGRGIHAGEWFSALFPDGWHDVTLEVSWEPTGPGCWYISTPGFEDVCPIGLFVKV
jgi:hypothetical protein